MAWTTKNRSRAFQQKKNPSKKEYFPKKSKRSFWKIWKHFACFFSKNQGKKRQIFIGFCEMPLFHSVLFRNTFRRSMVVASGRQLGFSQAAKPPNWTWWADIFFANPTSMGLSSFSKKKYSMFTSAVVVPWSVPFAPLMHSLPPPMHRYGAWHVKWRLVPPPLVFARGSSWLLNMTPLLSEIGIWPIPTYSGFEGGW